VKLTIPPETANGRVFRLGGLGMPNLRNPEQRGDLYATIEVQLPQRLSQEEKELFQQLQNLREDAR
jgi:curved DNA-binding protein